MPAMHIQDFFEDKARKGAGAVAIAYALMALADAQAASARAIQKLGLGDASTPFGAVEALGMQIEKAAEIIARAMPSDLD